MGAIEVGLGDLKGRADVPQLDAGQESTVPGVFVAGELTGLALIRNAIEQGAAVVARIAERLAVDGRVEAGDPEVVDVAIVGAGPAGLAAALAARERGLSFVVLEQEQGLGGTVLNFPRRKLVLTRPVALPLGGGLVRAEYSKEELLGLFAEQLERHRLAVRFGVRLTGLEVGAPLRVETTAGAVRARQLVLALGRRGTPRRLGVPGEERSKVAYLLRDAESYRGQKVLVVGGGDSAIEAAVGLARQPGNEVTISYRKPSFVRLKAKNEQAIERLVTRGKVRVVFESEVVAIDREAVELSVRGVRERLANDAVFILIGGDPPFSLLRRIGVRFGDQPETRTAAGSTRDAERRVAAGGGG